MPLSEAEPYLDHLTSCSPCYRDFSQLQAQYRQRRTRMIFAVAASILVVVGLATWAMLRQQDQKLARVVVDLRNRSMSRGTEPPPTASPIEISRSVGQLDIYLPLASGEGPYEVRIASPKGDLVFGATGTARIEAGITVLPVNAGLSSASPGIYFLQVRKADAEWNSYELRIK